MQRSTKLTDTEIWPRFSLTCTFGPASGVTDREIGEETIVVFDPRFKGQTHWLAADSDSCISLEAIR